MILRSPSSGLAYGCLMRFLCFSPISKGFAGLALYTGVMVLVAFLDSPSARTTLIGVFPFGGSIN